MIELHTVARAAADRTEKNLENMARLAADMGETLKADDRVAFFHTDMEFHGEIIHICCNKTLEGLMHQLNEKIQRIRRLTTYVPRRIEDTIGVHDAILSAIRNRDEASAQESMKRHLDKVKHGVIKLFQNGSMTYFGGVSFGQ